VNESRPLWPAWALGAIAAVSGGICLALGIDPGWAAVATCLVAIPIAAWVELRLPEPSQPEPPEVDEEFVRRLEALAARMREELEARRAATPG
jgi:hypothetical protein